MPILVERKREREGGMHNAHTLQSIRFEAPLSLFDDIHVKSDLFTAHKTKVKIKDEHLRNLTVVLSLLLISATFFLSFYSSFFSSFVSVFEAAGPNTALFQREMNVLNHN